MPGDKSISHRAAMLASVASGASRITGFATSADCRSTLDCIQRLGVDVERNGQCLTIYGRGAGYKYSRPHVTLDAGNSGSTIRMLAGLLASAQVTARIDGDQSLRRRPMRRVIEPLRMMGAQIEARDDNFAPLEITGCPLQALSYASPLASAQVKTCVLFAGLFAEGVTIYKEPAPTRNHTELMLSELGASIDVAPDGSVTVQGGAELRALDYVVPGDPSSAAFFVAAATVLPDSQLVLRGVNLNPTRTAFLDVLAGLGASIAKQNVILSAGETVGDLVVTSSPLVAGPMGTVISGNMIPSLIDEIPVLAVVATQVHGRLEVRGAAELRVKESDRIGGIVAGIRALGGEIDEFEDGFAMTGPQSLHSGRVDSRGDHRIAMAFTIAGLIARGVTEIEGAEIAAVSFPEFYDMLELVAGAGVVQRPA